MVFNRGNADFLFPLPWFKLPLPFIAAALIYLGGSLRPNLWRQPLLIAVLAAAAVIIGAYPLTPLPGYPAWLNQAILAGILFVSSYAFKYFNGIDGIAAVITQPILWGIFFLAWIGAAPLFYGWLALGMVLNFAGLSGLQLVSGANFRPDIGMAGSRLYSRLAGIAICRRRFRTPA